MSIQCKFRAWLCNELSNWTTSFPTVHFIFWPRILCNHGFTNTIILSKKTCCLKCGLSSPIRVHWCTLATAFCRLIDKPNIITKIRKLPGQVREEQGQIFVDLCGFASSHILPKKRLPTLSGWSWLPHLGQKNSCLHLKGGTMPSSWFQPFIKSQLFFFIFNFAYSSLIIFSPA